MDDDRLGLPPELEARISALENGASDTDFDSSSWMWMLAFGVVLPVVLIFLGW